MVCVCPGKLPTNCLYALSASRILSAVYLNTVIAPYAAMLPKLGSGVHMPPNASLSLALALVCRLPLISPLNASRTAPSLLTSASLMPPSASLVCLMPFARLLSPLPPLWPMLLTARTTPERFFPASARLERSPTLESALSPPASRASLCPASVSTSFAAFAMERIDLPIRDSAEASIAAACSMRSASMTRCIEFSADCVLAVNSMEIESIVSAMILNPP